VTSGLNPQTRVTMASSARVASGTVINAGGEYVDAGASPRTTVGAAAHSSCSRAGHSGTTLSGGTLTWRQARSSKARYLLRGGILFDRPGPATPTPSWASLKAPTISAFRRTPHQRNAVITTASRLAATPSSPCPDSTSILPSASHTSIAVFVERQLRALVHSDPRPFKSAVRLKRSETEVRAQRPLTARPG